MICVNYNLDKKIIYHFNILYHSYVISFNNIFYRRADGCCNYYEEFLIEIGPVEIIDKIRPGGSSLLTAASLIDDACGGFSASNNW